MDATQSAILNQKITENYLSILEKTNQQLSLWSNPYGVSVGILSLLIAVLAIGTAYILWRNSNDQKEAVKNFFLEQEKVINKTNQQNSKRVKAYELKLDNLISEYTKQLKSTNADKKEIQKTINELRRERASVGFWVTPNANVGISGTTTSSSASTSSSDPWQLTRQIKCVACGKTYSSTDNTPTLPGMASGMTTYCPYCGFATNI